MTSSTLQKSLLELSRLSNLPTVLSNVLVGGAIAHNVSRVHAVPQLLVAIASSFLFYTGGMFLNDAFDRKVDAQLAPNRPIPRGAIRASTVFVLGFVQLGGAWLLVTTYEGLGRGQWLGAASGWASMLALLITCYDAYHKHNPLSPLLMGLCRVGVYGLSASLLLPTDAPAGSLHLGVRLGSAALLLLCYLMALTYWAKREARGVPSPLPIHRLIAGISLLDGILLVGLGHPELAPLGVVCFFVTLRLQRWVRGT